MKAESNLAKHGVSFDEARTVFVDETALIIPDPDHSQIEERHIILGRSVAERIRVVVYCFRDANAVIRLISARKASRKEKLQYYERLQ